MDKLNDFLLEYLDKEFMLGFIEDATKALKYTAASSYKDIEEAIAFLNEKKAVFQKETLDKKECMEAYKVLVKEVMETIDPLAITKDSLTYTFGPSLKAEIETYFTATKKNIAAQRVHDKDQAKFDKLVAKGITPDWNVAAAAVVDLELVKSNICHLIDRLVKHYEELLAKRDSRDYTAETVAVIDYLKANASGVVAKVTPSVAKHRAIKLMEEVGIAEPHKRFNQYPFEFSGGMRQRIVIAIALAANPDILICDEPTTALDVTIQSQILELINKLKAERHLSVIFITHDLGVVANMADRVAVMYAGKIVEIGTANDIFYDPKHPYTWALLSSMPDLDTNERLEAIPGTPPNMIYPPVGDAFAARNKYAMQIDFEKQPPMFQVSDTHYAATWLLHPDAPAVEAPKIIRDRIARMKEKRGADHAE
jgi:oligopeptide/dipeptide ABC transporter ATP-binding protein